MKVAITGANGQLGSDLCRILGSDAVPLDRSQLDITDTQAIRTVLHGLSVDALVNTAAWNQVDLAEDEPDAAWRTNALGPRALAQVCDELQLTLCHISTDFVFGADRGRSTPYTETDCPGPLSAYAVSKLAGDHFVAAASSRHFIVRTCGLYGHAGRNGHGNFVETMLRLGADRDRLSVVDDQVCTPSATADVAAAIVKLLSTDQFGVWNITNDGQTSWYDFARRIFALSGMDVEVEPITTEQFGAKAARPGFSVLDNSKCRTALDCDLPDWQSALAAYLQSR